MFFSERSALQVRMGNSSRSMSRSTWAVDTEGYGPKYSDPSDVFLRVRKIRGKRSFLIHIQGYVLSSLSIMLYRGRSVFIRLFSNNSASASLCTTMNLMSAILDTITRVLGLWTLDTKYDSTLFFRFLALPTYSIFPSESK